MIIFSRTWDSVGWFGTFAVLPEYQGRGIGKQLIAASLDYLRQEPGCVIGLETMLESPYNLGLYLRLGFQARFPTLLLNKTLEPSTADDVSLPCWSSADNETQKQWLSDLRQATGQVQPGLDYSKEIISADIHGLGETLVLTEGTRAIGMSVVWLVSSRENWGQEIASVQVLALHPDHTDTEKWLALVNATQALARSRGKQMLTVPMNAGHTWAVEQLLRWDFRVERAMVRMVLKGTDDGPSTDECVNCSRWAG